ncbi:ATP-grasp domain-containing protein [uncultured Mailhella sp.]|uniref:ATP-grasp domain-containing protein n=1 Tax=uncultured Mailhella sp. TaxID=1981031 RepID=UPI0025EF6760|nr:ATP-grasp domain-containing protein [uncultured Mailhella sp.]
MKKVLVFPCGSEIGLEINRSLADSTHFELYGASSVDDHGLYVYRNYVGGLPNISDDDCIDRINDVIDRYGIDFLFPAHDSAVLSFARNAEKLHAVVVTSPLETCEICRSKLKTYARLSGVVPVPAVYEKGADLTFPLFAKPDVGQGSRGAHKITTQKEYDYFVADTDGLVLSEFLPGAEFTVDCFTDRHGHLLFCKGRRRARISNGISVHAVPVDHPGFRTIAESINNSMTFRGMWFFQVKERANGELVLMEIAPRIAGTMGLFRGAGVNFAQLSLFDAMNYDVDVFMNECRIENDRALYACYKTDIDYDTIYIDFDDTITSHGKVNPDVMRLLYQARNQNKHIIIISRHTSNIQESMRNYCIDMNLFDDIIIIDDKSTKKSSFIKTRHSIFIDDSFAERKDVFNNCGIPVFSVDAIEVLIDNRK